MFRTCQSLVVGLLLLGSWPVSGEEPRRFEFVIAGDDAKPTVTSRAALLDAPAGKHGFVSINDSHFHVGGERIRFWGMNMCFPANFPTHADADRIAPHLAKLGVNAVRFHHVDTADSPSGIWGPVDADGNRPFDPEMVDRLDYFLAKLHEVGIYANLNMHVGRQLTPAEGFPELEDAPWWATCNKWVMYYDRNVQAKVKEYCRRMLDHRNPYRDNLRRADDPGIALVELMNENYFSEQGYSLYRKLPGRFQRSLILAWNDWLIEQYGETDAMLAAWQREQPAMGDMVVAVEPFRERLTNLQINGDRNAIDIRFGVASPPQLSGDLAAVRIEVTKPSDKAHAFQLGRAGLTTTKDEPLTLTYWVRADEATPYTVELSSTAGGDWRSLGLFETLTATPNWTPVRRTIIPGETIDSGVSFQLSFGNSDTPIEFAGIQIQRGIESKPLPPSENLRDRTVDVPGPDSHLAAHRDMRRFMIDTELAWVSELKAYVRDDLGVKVPLTASQVNYHTPEVNVRLNDFIDLHNYWHHPEFPSEANWDPDRWTIGNEPMEADPLRSDWPANSLLMRTPWRLAGKPMTLSEYNYPEPATYSAGCVAMAAMIGALQDWDGIFFFQYDSESKTSDDWFRDQTTSFFSFNGQPVKLATFSTFANVFLRGDLKPLDAALVAPLDDPLPGSLGMEYQLAVAPEVDRQPHFDLPDPSELSTPDGSVVWESDDDGHGVIAIDAGATVGVWGTIGSATHQVGDATFEVQSIEPNYGFLIASSVDGDSINAADRIVLLAATNSENQAMGWNADRTSVGRNWGRGPTTIVGIDATVKLPVDSSRSWTVHALAGDGSRLGQVETRRTESGIEFEISAASATLWYEIAAGL